MGFFGVLAFYLVVWVLFCVHVFCCCSIWEFVICFSNRISKWGLVFLSVGHVAGTEVGD